MTHRATCILKIVCFLQMECIQLADGSRLSWEDSQEFVTKVSDFPLHAFEVFNR